MYHPPVAICEDEEEVSSEFPLARDVAACGGGGDDVRTALTPLATHSLPPSLPPPPPFGSVVVLNFDKSNHGNLFPSWLATTNQLCR